MLHFILIALFVALLPATNFFGFKSGERDASRHVPMTDEEFWERSRRAERRAALWKKINRWANYCLWAMLAVIAGGMALNWH